MLRYKKCIKTFIIGVRQLAVEDVDGCVWLSLTVVNQVPFFAIMYAEGNKFYSTNLFY